MRDTIDGCFYIPKHHDTDTLDFINSRGFTTNNTMMMMMIIIIMMMIIIIIFVFLIVMIIVIILLLLLYYYHCCHYGTLFLVDPVGFLHGSFSGPGSDAAPGPQVAVPRQLDCWGSWIVGCGDLHGKCRGNHYEIYEIRGFDLHQIDTKFHLNNQFHFGVLI